MGLRAYRYYTSTSPFVINKKNKIKTKRNRWEKHSEKFCKEKKFSSEARK